jgi:hypothetical protein
MIMPGMAVISELITFSLQADLGYRFIAYFLGVAGAAVVPGLGPPHVRVGPVDGSPGNLVFSALTFTVGIRRP